MSRITGTEVVNLMEAYNQVYVPQELTEEQIWEEVENWVNSLIEEGYDLSDYTWEEMYEYYLNEAGNPGAGLVQKQRLQQAAQNYARTSSGGTLGAGGGRAAMDKLIRQGVNPKSAYARVYTQGEKNVQQAGRQPAQSTAMYGRYGLPSAQVKTPVSAPRPSISAAPAPRPAAPAPRPAAPAPRPATSAAPAPRPAVPAPTQSPKASTPTKTDIAFSPSSGNLAARTATTPTPASTSSSAAAPVRRPLPVPGPRTRAQVLGQSFDPFDVIKGHLLDEGYADTEEAALKIMANMSEEWKQSIWDRN